MRRHRELCVRRDRHPRQRKIGQRVRLKGFRPGKVPPRILDQYVGRAAVLGEAVNDALPKLYSAAVRDNIEWRRGG